MLEILVFGNGGNVAR